MMPKVRVFLFIFLILLISSEADAKSRKKPSRHDYLMQIIQAYEKQIKDELNLEMNGKGFTTNDKVEEFKVYLSAERRATLQEARVLQLLAINKLVQIINSHKEIQPYLVETPFTFNHIKMSINFDGPFGRSADGTVTYMFNAPGSSSNPENAHHFFYYATDPITEDFNILKEPYQEALRIAGGSPIENPKVHHTTPLEEISDQVFLKFGKELAEKHCLYLRKVGGDFTHNEIERIGANFVFCSPATPEEARRLLLLAIEKISNTVNQDPRLKPYLKPYPFPTSGLNIRIEFVKMIKSAWGPPNYHDGSMHNVEMKDNVLSYYISPLVKKASEWEDCGIVHFGPSFLTKETYQEALEATCKTPPTPK